MALEIGQVVQTSALFPTRRGAGPDETAADQTGLPAAGRQPAPPLTGVGGKQLSGEALQTLQGAGEPEDADAGSPEGDLTEEEEKQVQELRQRDQEVRRHEAAHAAVGGQYAGAPTFSYTQGPDGKRYATGGEVSIDTSPGRTPEETARKADQIRAAALAPADPSGQDRAVAAAAAKMKSEAQAEAAKQRLEEQQGGDEEGGPQGPGAPEPATTAGPKPVGAEDEGETESAAASGDRRAAAAAQSYGRAGGFDSQRDSQGLSLVA